MGKFWKKYFLLIVTVIVTVSMTACDKKTIETMDDTQDATYSSSEINVSGIDGDIKACFMRSDKLYIHTLNGSEDGESNSHVYVTGLEGGEASEIKLDIPDASYVGQIFVNTGGEIIGTLYSGNHTELVKYSAEGNELLRADMMNAVKLMSNNDIVSIVEDSGKNIVVLCNQNIYFFDSNLNMTGTLDIDDMSVTDISLSKNGQILCNLENVSSGEAGAFVCTIDTEKKKIDKRYEIAINGVLPDDLLMEGLGGYDFYYKDETGVYGYEADNKKALKLIDYVASSMTVDEADGLLPVGSDKFIGINSGESAGENSDALILYTKMSPEELANQKVITVGIFGERKDIRQAAVAFHKSHKDYRIEFKDYSEGEGDRLSAMNMDILTGKNMDVIVLDFLPINQYVSSNALEDLTPYYEKDLEISEKDLIDSVSEAMKIDGKLYYVSPGFNIRSVAARTKDVGDGYGWTYDDMKKLLTEKGGDVSLFYDEDTTSKSELLTELLYNGVVDFVDWESGECNFESQEFKEVLELCNERGLTGETEMSDADIQELVSSVPEKLQSGKVLLYRVDTLNFESMQQAGQIFGEDVTYIGYPNKEKQGSYFKFVCPMGICSTSEQKDVAWEFLRTFMTREYQGLRINDVSTPTRKDIFELQLTAKMATDKYIDEFGQEIKPLEDTWMWGTFTFQKSPLSKQEADTYVDLVNHIFRTSSDDETMLNIVVEEAEAYFSGKRSIDETTAIIQNRCKTYVNEHR